MKKKLFLLFLLFTQVLMASSINYEDLTPGFYAVIDDEYILLDLTHSDNHYDPVFYPDDSVARVRYPGETSKIQCTGQFLLVCDTNQEEARLNHHEYACFARFVTPPWFKLVRLQRSRKGRYYQVTKVWPIVVGAVLGVGGVEWTPKKSRPIPFGWKKVGKGVFTIDIQLDKGEYAFVLQPNSGNPPDVEHIFDFTIIE